MTGDRDGSTVAEELRERASSFVNNHVGLWVTVEDEGTLVLAGGDAAALFRAAGDWLAEDSGHAVAGVEWRSRSADPAHALRLRLRLRAPVASHRPS